MDKFGQYLTSLDIFYQVWTVSDKFKQFYLIWISLKKWDTQISSKLFLEKISLWTPLFWIPEPRLPPKVSSGLKTQEPNFSRAKFSVKMANVRIIIAMAKVHVTLGVVLLLEQHVSEQINFLWGALAMLHHSLIHITILSNHLWGRIWFFIWTYILYNIWITLLRGAK